MTPEESPLIWVEEEPSLWTVLREEAGELRWYVLAVACFLTFGSSYIYDFPGSIGTGSGPTIEQLFEANGRVYTAGMNQYLYSVYAWPNTVLSVVGGLLIDKYLGLQRAMALFISLILCGSALFYMGVHTTNYWMLILGRVVFGLGGESLSVSQSAFLVRWFKGKRGMALAFCITISFSRIGSSFNFLFAPAIAYRRGVEAVALSGVAACLVSVGACAILVVADRYAERSGYLALGAEGSHETEAQEEEAPRMKLSDITRTPFAYWLLCTVCVFCYTSIFPFMGIGKNFFEVKYGYTGSTAARYLSFFQITSAVVSPIIGIAVDSVGRNTWWLILASVFFAAIHILFITTMIPGEVLMVVLGACYGFLVSGLWPSIPWAVDDAVVGVAYGVMTSIQNIGLALFPMLVGALLDHFPSNSGEEDEQRDLPTYQGFMWAESLFLLSSLLALLASILLLAEDQRTGGVLSAPSKSRQQIVEEMRRQQNNFDGVVPEPEDEEYEEEDGDS